MKKLFIAATCALLCAALVTPALADHKLGGYFRTQAIMNNVNQNLEKDGKPKRWVDNRIRARWQNNINEYVTTVWYVEADFPWGMAGSTPSGSTETGGKFGADGVNIETKNAYAEVKIPETPVALTMGILGFGDNFDSVLINDDIAGIKADLKFGMADVVLLYAKNEEGNQQFEDDENLYWAEVNLKPADIATVGVTAAYRQNQATDTDNYYFGVNGGVKLQMIDLSGWFLYNGGTVENGAPDGDDQDISAWALSVSAKGKVDPISYGAGVLVMSKDDDENDDMSLNGGQGAFQLYGAGLQIFLADIYYNNQGGRGAGGRLAIDDAGQAGYGLYGIWGNAMANLPNNMYVKGAAGYFSAMDDKRNGEDEASREGTSLGIEVGAMVGIKVAEKADFSLRGHYAFLGDFYDKSATDEAGEDPENLYTVVLMLNVPY